MNMGNIEQMNVEIQPNTMRKKARSRVGNYPMKNNTQDLGIDTPFKLKGNSSAVNLILNERNKSLGASPQSNKLAEKS